MKVSAPGKLVLSGEWAILKVGNPGIVAAVSKRVFAELGDSPDEHVRVSIEDFGIQDKKALFDGKELVFQDQVDGDKVKFLKAAVETSLGFLKERGVQVRPFAIRTWGEDTNVELGGTVKKVGFGSSAASVVAVVKGVLDFHGQEVSHEELYKLSVIVHYFAQGKVGSAFDVAASVFGGVFVYKRFDPSWLVKQMEGKGIREIVDAEWPGFAVEQLEIPEGFIMNIGWTRESASTSAMVKQLNAWAAQHQEDYQKAFDGIASLVRELMPAWKEKNTEKILQLLRRNEELLRELGEQSGVNIETPGLKQLSELANHAGGAGKLSGAGGGDCGIGICFDHTTSEKIKQAWTAAGVHVIDAGIDREGARKE